MFFLSTRNVKIIANFKDAVLNPVIKQKGGLFVPSNLPVIDNQTIHSYAQKNYTDILVDILHRFCNDVVDLETVKKLVYNAFSCFNKNFKITLPKYINSKHDKHLNDGIISIIPFEQNTHLANLTFGGSGDFRDFGYCLTAEFVNYFNQTNKQKSRVVDLSLDKSCCSSVLAIQGKENMEGFALIPSNENDDIKNLLYFLNNKNVYYASTNGDVAFFNSLKEDLFNNTSFQEIENIVFINEYNILNILSYIPLFFQMYIQANFKPFCVSIPTDTMTLGLSAYLAKRIGVPIQKIVLAVEANDCLLNFQEIKTIINGQNFKLGCSEFATNFPKNFERLLFLLCNADCGTVMRTMNELELSGRYKVNNTIWKRFVESFFVADCSNQFDIQKCVNNVVIAKEIYLDQHFAISKIGAEIAKNKLGLEISAVPMFLMNICDYRRNLKFINNALGYKLENIDIPWGNGKDIQKFSAQELQNDKDIVFNYMFRALNGEILQDENNAKKDETK